MSGECETCASASKCVMCDFYDHLASYGLSVGNEVLDNNFGAWDFSGQLPELEEPPIDKKKPDESRERIDKMISELTESVKTIQEDQRSMKKALFSLNYTVRKQARSLFDLESRLEAMESSVVDLMVENVTLNESVRVLEDRVNQLDLESKRNNLEIHGVPERAGEDVEWIVTRIGEALGLWISRRDIDYAQRCKPMTPEDNHHTWIDVRFNSHRLKTEMLRLRKERGSLTTDDIQLGNEKGSRIYINEHSATSPKKIPPKARHKENRVKYVWVKDGKVFARRKNCCKVVEIKRPEQLNKVGDRRHEQEERPGIGELIRQVTVSCAERGVLLLRVRDEIQMTTKAYQTLYESSIAFGIRKSLLAEEGKESLKEEIKQKNEEVQKLEEQLLSMKQKYTMMERRAEELREAEERKHQEEIAFLKKANAQLKAQLEAIIAPKK